MTSNKGLMEQPELMPMPNGYGIVMFPHLVAQPCLAVVAASPNDFCAVVVGGG